MGHDDKSDNFFDMDRREAVIQTQKIIEQVKLELGNKVYPYMTKAAIAEIVRERLPKVPIYGVPTIVMIMNGSYK